MTDTERRLQLVLNDVWEWLGREHTATGKITSKYLDLIDRLRADQYIIEDGMKAMWDENRKLREELEQIKSSVNKYRSASGSTYTPNGAVRWVGGKKIGRRISVCLFELLKKHGLRKEHFLLDIGAGCFRCSKPIMRHLNFGRYFALDGDIELLKVGWSILPDDIKKKNPKFASSWEWDFGLLDNKHYDFMVCQGVICHIPEYEIRKLFASVDEFLRGKAFISFVEGERTDKDVYRWQLSDLKSFTDGTDLELHHIGEWGHPRNLKMIYLTKKKRGKT